MNRIVSNTAILLCLFGFSTADSYSANWVASPSYYTHNPETGERVTQFARAKPAMAPTAANYVRSGYRHTQSRIQVQGSANHLHVTEEWGNPVRPYGEWTHPYRPYSVPYDQWGPPYGGLNYVFPPYYGGFFPGSGHSSYPRNRQHEGNFHPEKLPRDEFIHQDSRHDHRRRNRGFRGPFRHRETTDEQFFWPRPNPEHEHTPPTKPKPKPKP